MVETLKIKYNSQCSSQSWLRPESWYGMTFFFVLLLRVSRPELHVKSLNWDIKTFKTLGFFRESHHAMLGLGWSSPQQLLTFREFLVKGKLTYQDTLTVFKSRSRLSRWWSQLLRSQSQYWLRLSLETDVKAYKLRKTVFICNQVKNATSIWNNVFRINTSKKMKSFLIVQIALSLLLAVEASSVVKRNSDLEESGKQRLTLTNLTENRVLGNLLKL